MLKQYVSSPSSAGSDADIAAFALPRGEPLPRDDLSEITEDAGAMAQTGGASGTSGGAAAKSGSDTTAPMATTGERAAMDGSCPNLNLAVS